ncbi:MAG: mitochondrial large ribosomal subunit protein uL15m [Candidatus Micrarchaeota archaeon]|nr:mitochondrial large ribosomal subunit protein uL15m [Candidatus Micrarchaeota archaeon]
MVVRREKRDRKYLGTRRWGAGNIKNARGKGDRGGVGKGGKKHKWTYVTAKTPELIRSVGFKPWSRSRLKEITLRNVDRMLADSKDNVIELKNYKVLSNGSLSRAITIKASGFSATAIEKIKSSGGDAVKI